MKRILKTVLVLFLAISVQAQDPIFGNFPTCPKKVKWTQYIAPATTAFLSGAAYGTAETILFHQDHFFRVHPNANPKFWDYKQSWENKWALDGEGRVQVGKERFFGSSTAFVWTTDGYHLLRTLDNTMISATFLLYPTGERKWWQKGLEIVGLSIARKAGFHLTYSLIYR